MISMSNTYNNLFAFAIEDEYYILGIRQHKQLKLDIEP